MECSYRYSLKSAPLRSLHSNMQPPRVPKLKSDRDSKDYSTSIYVGSQLGNRMTPQRCRWTPRNGTIKSAVA